MSKISQNIEAEKRPNWIKRIGIAGAGTGGLLIALYLFCTSGYFIQSQVLSRVADQLNATIKVQSISVGLFSGVSLSGLDVRTGESTLIKADKAVMRYGLMDLLSGRIRVSEFSIEAPEVNVVIRQDGSTNLDPITDALAKNESTESTSSGPLDLLIRNISLTDARFRFEQTSKDGVKQVTVADQVKINIDQLGTGIAGNLSMQTRIKFESGPASLAPTDGVIAMIVSKFEFDLDANLMPKRLSGGAQLNVAEAIGALRESAQLEGVMVADLEGDAIRGLSLKFKRGQEPLGELGVMGTFDINSLSGKLLVSINNIGKSVLGVVGAPLQMSFGDSLINSRNEITIAGGGEQIDATGELTIDDFSISQQKLSTPASDLKFKYAGAFDKAKELAHLRAFDLSGADQGREFLTASLSQPLTYSLSTNATETSTSAKVALQIKELDLARWAGVVGDFAKAGKVDVDLSVTALRNGQLLKIEAKETLSNASVVVGTNLLAGLNTDASVKLSVADMSAVNLELLSVRAERDGVRLLGVNAAGKANLETKSFDVGVSSMVDLANSLLLFPVPDVALSQAGFSFVGRLAGDADLQKVDGKLTVPVLTGVVASNRLDRFATELDVAAALKGQRIELYDLSGNLMHKGMPAGTLKAAGGFAMDSGEALAKFSVTNLNHAILGQFIEPALGGSRLASIRVDVDADASFSPKGTSAIKGNLNIGQLVIQDPNGMIPADPIGVVAAIDAAASLGGAGIQLKVPLLRGAVTANGVPAGNFDAQADFNGASQSGNFRLSASGFNEVLLAPLSKGFLGDKSLRSVTMNATAGGRFDLAKTSEINANLWVTNLVVHDPSGQLPAQPMSLQMGLLGEMNQKLLDFKNFRLKIDPTARAENEIQISGRVDMTDPAATAANLIVSANSLDLTPYYDLLENSKAQTAAPAPVVAPPVGDPLREPDAITLPLRNSRFDVRVGRIYLREIEVSNLVATASVDRQSIAVAPAQMYVSGAPVQMQLNLLTGVPGFKYNLQFRADRVPIRPALMSFQPAVGRTARGELVADLKIDGGGVTGRSLKRTLNGHVDIYLTNAMIKLTPDRPVAPPSAGVTGMSMLRGVGQEFMSTGLKGIGAVLGIPDLTQSPITHVATSLRMGQGNVILRSADVRSATFVAQATGVIPIQDVLTNSPLAIPVDMWLSRAAASALQLDPGTGAYAQLPRFVEMRGTIGAPETFIDKTAIATLLLGRFGGLAGGAGKAVGNMLNQGKKEAGGLLGGLGGLLGGNKQQAPNQNTQTNKPSKNPFQLFNIPLPK